MEAAGQASIPPYNELLWPALRAVRDLGHSAKLDEIDERVIEAGFGKTVQVDEIEPLRKAYLARLADERKIKEKAARAAGADPDLAKAEAEAEADDWREELLRVLLQMDPTAFEHLAKRLLRALPVQAVQGHCRSREVPRLSRGNAGPGGQGSADYHRQLHRTRQG